MGKVIGEDALRRAPSAISEDEGIGWLDGHLCDSTAPLLDVPWILDIDTTIKPLYGKQEGAVVSYNPKKPGRSSYSDHSDLMAGLRLVLGVEVKAGGEHSGSHTLLGLLRILEDLPAHHPPERVRGDWASARTEFCANSKRGRSPICSSGVYRRTSSATLSACFGSRVGRMRARAGKGSTARSRSLAGRTSAAGSCCAAPRKARYSSSRRATDGLLGFIEADRKNGKRITGYEYAVRVTHLDHEILSLGQLYRDRADTENAFDELKNPWGWGGFTTHDRHRCQLSARAVALIYNGWSLFVRLANPEARLEAMTRRPWLMSSVGRAPSHAGKPRSH
jgi:hypothetical protein